VNSAEYSINNGFLSKSVYTNEVTSIYAIEPHNKLYHMASLKCRNKSLNYIYYELLLLQTFFLIAIKEIPTAHMVGILLGQTVILEVVALHHCLLELYNIIIFI